MSVLSKRKPLHPARFRRVHHAAKAFHAPQREHPAKVQHPKPVKAAA